MALRYAAVADMAARLDSKMLIDLTDDIGSGEQNDTIIEAALAQAEEEVDEAIGMRYELPLPSPVYIKNLVLDLAVVNLFARRPEHSPGDVWQIRQQNATKRLDQIRRGERMLGPGDPQGSGNRQPVMFSSRTGVFGGGGVMG